jgi:prepilin signal peptidase PulO-like enzyme (type II secretory pathway)
LLMIIAVLVLLGLCAGSFANALVWRVHEQEMEKAKKKPDKQYLRALSVGNGRSICPHCRHILSAKDLAPLFSWIFQRGKCRYCGKPISAQYPAVELGTASLFVASYIWWPELFTASQSIIFGLWLLLVTGLTALVVYDLRWFLLPDRILAPLTLFAVTIAAIVVISSDNPINTLIHYTLAILVGGGVFYVIFQVSAGKWIGGGDVKLGFLLGLVAGTPARSLLLLFLASVIGTLVSLPLLATKRLTRTAVIPFGPFLIVSLVIVQLFGADILDWYRHTVLSLS